MRFSTQMPASASATSPAKLSLHHDRDYLNFDQPILSVSLSVNALFPRGFQTCGHRLRRILLYHCDVVVWDGPAQLTFHGIDKLAVDEHQLTGMLRNNLTFRAAA
jgi:alkylated DNA repair protein (DNA oxidative demethylase)